MGRLFCNFAAESKIKRYKYYLFVHAKLQISTKHCHHHMRAMCCVKMLFKASFTYQTIYLV